DAIDLDLVEAVVHAGGGDGAGAGVDRQARVEAGEVVQRAVAGGGGLELAAADGGADALVVRVEGVQQARTGHLHGGDLGHVAQGGVDGADLVQLQVHAFLGRGALGRSDGDGVRATRAQAARGVAAVGVGGGAADRAGLDVDDRHLGAGDRLAAGGGNSTGDTRGSALGERRSNSEGGDQSKGELGHPGSTVIGHG